MDHKAPLFDRVQHGGLHTTTRGSLTTGNVWFVDSNAVTPTANRRGLDAIGYGESPDTPFLTLNYASTQCIANNGDVIYVMPGHTEALRADGSVTLGVAGISVIGLSYGADRPTFTATVIAGDFKLAAKSVYIENLLFLSGVDATTGMLAVESDYCTIKNCEMRDLTDEATDFLVVSAGSHNLLLDGLKIIGAAGGGGNGGICIIASDDVEIKNFNIYGNWNDAGIDFRTGHSHNCNIHDGLIWTEHADDICIKDTITATIGFIGPNLILVTQDDAGGVTSAVTGATFQMMPPVLVCNLDGEKGGPSGWVASTDA